MKPFLVKGQAYPRARQLIHIQVQHRQVHLHSIHSSTLMKKNHPTHQMIHFIQILLPTVKTFWVSQFINFDISSQRQQHHHHHHHHHHHQ